jgi:hypothetical protein
MADIFIDRMIKQLKKSDISIMPFVATKAWELFNIDNQDSVLLEPLSGSEVISDTCVAMDYIDYNVGPTPIWSNICNIALEQQVDDQVIYEEGISGSKESFDINSSKNNSGTYKTLLYTQIFNAFYNRYHNPSQIFGMENIDFPLSQTNRYIADNFRMFTIPRKFFGDKLVEKSIKFYDATFDDNVYIYDDGSGNLIVSSNLFSKIQEVRSFNNNVISGSISEGGGGEEIPPYSGIRVLENDDTRMTEDGFIRIVE